MLGQTLKRLRLIYGYSAREMSEALRISSSYLSEIEREKKEPSLTVLQRYSEVFNLKLSTLLRFSEQMASEESKGTGQQFITKLMTNLIERYSGAGE